MGTYLLWRTPGLHSWAATVRIVFFNDIEDKIQHANVIIYADDTVVCHSNVDVNTIEDVY